ncbi:MAG: glycoside hydrolase family 16 protein [Sphingobacteriaceae bacterium]
MKQKLFFIFFIILAFSASVYAQKSKTGWKLVWSDEFNNPAIDTAVWKFEHGYVRNKELQYYTSKPENAAINHGNLVITTLKAPVDSFAYTSASLQTRGTKSFLYGRIEMRAKLPSGPGIWPAFWTLGNDLDWPNCGEIDIMEMWGGDAGDGKTTGNAHWQQDGKHANADSQTYQLPGKEKLADAYHIYAVEWSKDQIKFFLDEHCFFTFEIDNEAKAHGFRQPHFLLVNTAITPWDKNVSKNTYPQKYMIDYIRVYQTPTGISPK